VNNREVRSVRVGILDSGWTARVPDARVVHGRGFVMHDDPFRVAYSLDHTDRIGHGTSCSRVILEIAESALVTPLRVFGSRLETSPAVLLAALDWCLTQRFDVLNLSLSTDREDSRDSLYVACESLRRAGTTIVAAARNGFDDGYPAVFDNVLGVTMLGSASGVASSASTRLDFTVKSEWVRATAAVDMPLRGARSSFAAAFVSGHAARVLADIGPLELDEVRERLRDAFAQL
jgi:subtilisin family serine protease